MKKLIFLLLLPVLAFGQMRIETKKYSSDGYYNVAIPMHKQVKGVVWFFHGSGQVGNTLESINSDSGPYHDEIPKMLRDTTEYPYIFIWQQLHTGKTDWTKDEINPMFPIIDLYSNNGALPKHITGLSLGGRAIHLCLRLALLYNKAPGYFSTAGAICGSTINNLVSDSLTYQGGLKIHLWHGALDGTVKPGPDRTLYKNLYPIIGDNIKYIEYPNDGHGIWSKVYTKEYFPWIESVTKPALDIQSITKILVINGSLYIETDRGFKYISQITKLQ